MEDILGLVDPDIRQGLDMTEIMLRIVDGSRMSQFKPQFGKGMLTVWAHIHGQCYSCHNIFFLSDNIRTSNGNHREPKSSYSMQ